MPGDPNKLVRLGKELVQLAHAMTGKGSVSFRRGESNSVSVILGLYSKSVKTFQATHLLCKAGFAEDAQSLLRCLVETLVNIKYVRKKDSEKRAMEYLLYTDIQDLKLMNAVENNPGLRGLFSEKGKKIIRARAKKAKKVMGEREFEKRYKAGAWHGKKIEKVFHDVGRQSLYDLPFRQGSRSVHATDFIDHFEMKKEGGFVL